MTDNPAYLLFEKVSQLAAELSSRGSQLACQTELLAERNRKLAELGHVHAELREEKKKVDALQGFFHSSTMLSGVVVTFAISNDTVSWLSRRDKASATEVRESNARIKEVVAGKRRRTRGI